MSLDASDYPLSPSSFARLIRAAREGDGDAAERLVLRYRQHVLAVVRRRLGRHPEMRAVVDASDVCQSVFRRLFRSLRAGQHSELSSPDAFVRLLLTIASNRFEDLVRHYRAQRRDRSREEPLPERADYLADTHVLDPSDHVTFAETREGFLRCLAPWAREIWELRRSRVSWRAIADQLGEQSQGALQKRYTDEIRRAARASGLL